MKTLQYTGSLASGALYVRRRADELLLNLLREGHYCNVLAPRQIGKSSLRVRTAAQLVADGWRVAQIDLTSYGSSRTPEEWFFGLAEQLSRDLGEADPYDFWKSREGLTPAAKWARLIEEWAERSTAPIAIFLDEIEAVRLVKFAFDEFFLTIRALSDRRSQSPALARVRFCFLGATSPSDLIQLKTITPFNSTERVRLDDFSLEELLAAAGELAIEADGLRSVYEWTAGHPYMTMRVLHAMREDPAAGVNAVVDRLFLTQPFEDPNLQYAANRFDSGPDRFGARLLDKVELYGRLLEGGVELGVEEAAAQDELWLCGMVKRPQAGQPLRIRNRIFATVFDQKWLDKRRQRSRIGSALHVWTQFEKQDAMLLRDEALREAEELAKKVSLSAAEVQFIEASQKAEISAREAEAKRLDELLRTARDSVSRAQVEQRSSNRRAKIFGTIMGAAVLVAGSLLAFTFSQLRELNRQTNELEQSKLALENTTLSLRREKKEAEDEAVASKKTLDQIRNEIRATNAALDKNRKEVQIGIKLAPILRKEKIDCTGDCAAKVKERLEEGGRLRQELERERRASGINQFLDEQNKEGVCTSSDSFSDCYRKHLENDVRLRRELESLAPLKSMMDVVFPRSLNDPCMKSGGGECLRKLTSRFVGEDFLEGRIKAQQCKRGSDLQTCLKTLVEQAEQCAQKQRTEKKTPREG